MLLKGMSVGYLFEQSWVLSSSQQGRYLRMNYKIQLTFGRHVETSNV